MDVVLVVADPDRADAFERAVLAEGHRALRLPRAFNKVVDALNAADVVVADLAQEPATATWCLAYALARSKLAVACARPTDAVPSVVRDNPSPYQRLVVGESRDAATALGELLRL